MSTEVFGNYFGFCNETFQRRKDLALRKSADNLASRNPRLH